MTQQRQANNYDVLKCVALVAMTLDHISFFLMQDVEWLRILGRAAAPLFLVLVGYNASFRFRITLLVAAIIVTLLDGFIMGMWVPQSILWTILIARMVLSYAVPKFRPFEITMVAAAFIPITAQFLDFGSFAILFGLVGYRLRQGRDEFTALLLGASLLLFYGWTCSIILPESTASQMIAVAIMFVALAAVIWRTDYLAPVRIAPRFIALFSASALYYYVAHKAVLELMAHGLKGSV